MEAAPVAMETLGEEGWMAVTIWPALPGAEVEGCGDWAAARRGG